MNVEIGAEAVQFPEREYINGIAFAVRYKICQNKIISLPQRTNAENSKQIFLEKELRAATVPISTYLCLWAIYIFPRLIGPAYSAKGKYVDRSYRKI